MKGWKQTKLTELSGKTGRIPHQLKAGLKLSYDYRKRDSEGKKMNQDLNDQIKNYLEELTLAGKSLTHVRYASKLFKGYLEETGLDPLLLKLKDAQSFQVYLTTKTSEEGEVCYTKASVLNIIGSITAFYDHLKRKQQVFANPFLEIDRVKRNASLPRNIPNEGDMNRFLTHLRNFNKPRTLTQKRQRYKAHVMAELMYATGARINEVSKLKPEDLDFSRGTVTLTDSKTGSTRTGFLNDYAKQVLKLYLEQMQEHILFGKNGADKSLLFGAKTNLRTWFNTILNKESERLNLGPFTSHNFRHAVGFHLLRNGCDIRFIQEILGHKRLNSTQVYTKVDKEDLKNVLDRFHPRVWKSREKKP